MHGSARNIFQICHLEIPCNDSAKTRFDSYVSVNVLQNFASSFASCNSTSVLLAGLASFDGVEFNADDDDDDDEEAVDEVAPLLDDDSWSSLNELAYTVNDKGFADAEPPHI